MKKYQKDFTYELTDVSSIIGLGQMLYNICDWLISLNIGFTSYSKSEELIPNSSAGSVGHQYWYANLMSETGKTINLVMDAYVTLSGGKITGMYNSSSSLGVINDGYGSVGLKKENYSVYLGNVTTAGSTNSNPSFTVTVYHKNNGNMIIGIESSASKSTYGFSSGVFILLCTANGEQLLTNAKVPIYSGNTSTSYAILTDGNTLKYNYRAILDKRYLSFSGSAILLKAPLTTYGASGITDYETTFDYIYQTNSSVVTVGNTYTINGKDYFCYNETLGMLMEC